jgi:hypothetical protein
VDMEGGEQDEQQNERACNDCGHGNEIVLRLKGGASRTPTPTQSAGPSARRRIVGPAVSLPSREARPYPLFRVVNLCVRLATHLVQGRHWARRWRQRKAETQHHREVSRGRSDAALAVYGCLVCQASDL